MNPKNAVNIEDLRIMARRRLPGFIYDMIDGGVEDECGVQRNTDAFRGFQLCPRFLTDISQRSQGMTLFGQSYASPFGISATGPAPIYRRGADETLCRVAMSRGIPFILSGAGGASVESIAQLSDRKAWWQLYTANDRSISEDQIRRAADAGLSTLVVTVDTPISPKRERHRRNGITTPIRFNSALVVRLIYEALKHPAWFVDYVLDGGMPRLGSWEKYARPGSTNMQVSEFFNTQFPTVVTWKDLENFRKLWPGNLVVKGVMYPQDAVRAVETGADGVTVSNHGGKVLDRAPAPLIALPAIKAAIGDRAAVMMDGGIRRGSDIVVARCLGADFVFTGRATLWGVSAGGFDGAARAVDILREEIDLVLGTVGCADFSALDASYIFDPDAQPYPFRANADETAASNTTTALKGSSTRSGARQA